MKLGMLHLFENPVGKTEHEVIKEQMELMYEAETLGFDSVWPAEHHFTEYGYCASPQVSLAAVAARTKRIRLGTGVVVLPFHNPVRVAEDFAFLDLMSDGRVDLGVGRGYQPGEYAGFGLADKQGESRAMFDEAINLVRQCWTEERVTFKGKYYQVDDLVVRPKPLQQPHPPIYMACLSAEIVPPRGSLRVQRADVGCVRIVGRRRQDRNRRLSRRTAGGRSGSGRRQNRAAVESLCRGHDGWRAEGLRGSVHLVLSHDREIRRTSRRARRRLKVMSYTHRPAARRRR